MKTLCKSIVIFLLFFIGTTAVVHVDRQCAHMNRQSAVMTEAVEDAAENIIEKYASLH